MNRRFVAIDVETTGLDPDADRITEVAAVRFDERGEILDSFASLVNPGRHIPAMVESLTGITNGMVTRAPRLPEIAEAFTDFISEDPIVGHNVGFDVGMLRREGVDLRSATFDTVHMARVLMPANRSRALGDLACELGIDVNGRHRALTDAETAARVFARLLFRAQELPNDTRVALARLLSIESIALAELIAGAPWDAAVEVGHPLPQIRETEPAPPLAKVTQPRPVDLDAVQRVLEAAAAVIPAFEERPQQEIMAEAVGRALADGGQWLIEAGTGVGKSLAYLIPAALHALGTGERVVIATSTLNLQEQLFARDIPAVRQALLAAGIIDDPGALRVAVLKGRANYLCVRRWFAGSMADGRDPDAARLAAQLLLWLPETETGDRGELNLDPASSAAWLRFSAHEADCLSRAGAGTRGGHCFLLRARRMAEAAHILVVNHALLLADIVNDGSALPPFDHLVVDEAHNLEDQATQQLGSRFTSTSVLEVLDALHRPGPVPGRGTGIASLLRALPDRMLERAAVHLQREVDRTASATSALFTALDSLLPPEADDERVPVTRSVRNSPDWTPIELAWGRMDAALLDLANLTSETAEAVVSTADGEEDDLLAEELESAAGRVLTLRSALAAVVGRADDSLVVWAGRERDRSPSLSAAPIDVGPMLSRHVWGRRHTVIATSATLSSGGSMSYTSRRLGLTEAESLQLGSPYDYRQSTLFAAVTDLPEPGQPGYDAASAGAITRLVRAAQGRSLVLFTSHAALRAVAEQTRRTLADCGIRLVAQGIDGSPRQLIDILRADARTAVLGTSSFWEGVDVRGPGLSLVIIARLPFAVPTDPVHRARSEQYDDPFTQFSLPQAVLRFRQGFGRLIRDRADRGAVVVLDRRIFERPYGPDFVQGLPDCTRLRADTESVAARVERWLEP